MIKKNHNYRWRRALVSGFFMLASIILISCRKEPLEVELLFRYPLDSTEGMIDAEYAEFDENVSRDGKGSIKITAEDPVIIRLYEIKEPKIHNLTLIYKAYARTKGLKGNVFLEMRVSFKQAKQIVRGLASKIKEDEDFTEIDTIFFLKKGHYPESVELNLVIEGSGTVWIDDIRIFKGPLTFLRAREF